MITQADINSQGGVAQIDARLCTDEKIDCKLGKQGRLHIDRPLPYLCVCRHTGSERNTEKLLQGQAAYLALDSQTKADRLIRAIVKRQRAKFGSFLIIELWLGETSENEDEKAVPHEFHIHAPAKNPCSEVIETFENSLQKICLRQRYPDVVVSFDDHYMPPDLPPLLSLAEAEEFNCVLVGLEVKPVYYDADGGFLPFAFQAIHRGLTPALRKVFYRFGHQKTLHRPAHYHELGPQALTKTVWKVDQQLAQISDSFDLLLHVTPNNTAQAWSDFQRTGSQVIPQFHYRPRGIDPSLVKRELYKIPLERIGDPAIADLFRAKRSELDRQLSLLNDRNTEAFLHGSLQLFGRLDDPLLKTAQDILLYPADSSINSDAKLNAQQLAQYARDELQYYRETDPSLEAKVEVRDDITGILVSHGNFLIAGDAQVSQARLCATLGHELGTHVLTYHNGKRQLLQQLYAGMPGYEELQEGLAVLAEYLTEGLGLPRLQLLAGRVIAVHNLCDGANFVDCFHSLSIDYNFHPNTAFTTTMRTYRGGGYSKDIIYLRGFLKLLEFLAGEEELELLFCGKIALEHLPLVRELRWRGVLKPLALTPRHLQDEVSKRRLIALRADPTIAHIMENL